MSLRDLWILTLWTLFCIADLVAYFMAKPPERRDLSRWVLVPGGGFYALIKCGRNKR